MEKIEQIFGVPQLFKRKEGPTIKLLMDKVTDHFLVSGKKQDIEAFTEDLKGDLGIGKVSVGGEFNLNGRKIKVGDAITELNMAAYFDRILPVPLSRSRKRQREDRENDEGELQ